MNFEILNNQMDLTILLVVFLHFSNFWFVFGATDIGKFKPQSKLFGLGNIFGVGGTGGFTGTGGNAGQTGNQVHVVNRGCEFGKRKYRATCVPLESCDAALSDQAAGIEPTKCIGYSGICCPEEPRISEIMCNKYKEIFKTYDSIGRYDYWCPVHRAAPAARMVGGRDALPNEFPHMVGLVWGNGRASLDIKCGGTLISDEYVLTAAHCFKKYGKPSYIVLGDVYRGLESQSKTRQILQIRKITLHPDFDSPKIYNDIALVQLEHKIDISLSILPACLPSPKLRHYLNGNITVLGWGQLRQEDKTQPNALQAVNMERTSHDDCKQSYEDQRDAPYRFPNGIINSQFCAGTINRDSCNGDSGGPATVANKRLNCLLHVVGVTSFGTGLCGYGSPGVYTNVQSYLDWIEEIVWPQAY